MKRQHRTLAALLGGISLALGLSLPALASAQGETKANANASANAGQSGDATAQAAASTDNGETVPPEKVARNAVEELLAGLEGNRQEFLRDPEGLYDLVDRVLIPLIDLRYTAQLVVGRAWRNATPEQKERFIRAFKVMMVQTYGNALIGFQEDQIEFLPLRAAEDAEDVTFKALAITDKGDKIPVNLDLHLVDGQWKVYNGSVGSLSFVTNYRAQFSPQIKRGGFEQLIKRMEKRYNVQSQPTNG